MRAKDLMAAFSSRPRVQISRFCIQKQQSHRFYTAASLYQTLSLIMAPQVGLEPTTLRLTAECSAIELLRNMGWGYVWGGVFRGRSVVGWLDGCSLGTRSFLLPVEPSFMYESGKESSSLSRSLVDSGNDLLSRAVSSQVPSARGGLTSVFGMGTGGTLQP